MIISVIKMTSVIAACHDSNFLVPFQRRSRICIIYFILFSSQWANPVVPMHHVLVVLLFSSFSCRLLNLFFHINFEVKSQWECQCEIKCGKYFSSSVPIKYFLNGRHSHGVSFILTPCSHLRFYFLSSCWSFLCDCLLCLFSFTCVWLESGPRSIKLLPL